MLVLAHETFCVHCGSLWTVNQNSCRYCGLDIQELYDRIADDGNGDEDFLFFDDEE